MGRTLWGVEAGMALMVYRGQVAGPDIVASTEALLADPAWRPGTAIVRDFTHAPVLVLNPGELEALVAFKAGRADCRASADAWVLWRGTRQGAGALHAMLARRAGLAASHHGSLGGALRRIGRVKLPERLAGLYGEVGA